MLYECLIHMPSRRLVDARLPAETRPEAVRPWSDGEASWDGHGWRDRGEGDFALIEVDLPFGVDDTIMLRDVRGVPIAFYPHQIDGRAYSKVSE